MGCPAAGGAGRGPAGDPGGGRVERCTAGCAPSRDARPRRRDRQHGHPGEVTKAKRAGPVTGSATPYRGRTAALATRHRKRPLIAAPLTALGLRVVVAGEVDTDQFGTFTGDRVRTPAAPGTPSRPRRGRPCPAPPSRSGWPPRAASARTRPALGSRWISNSSPSSTTTPVWSSSAAPEAPRSPGRPTR